MNSQQRRSRSLRRRAYTLIELVIVIALLGLASAVLIPNMVGNDVMRAEAAVRQLIADMSFAQADALANQEYRRVFFYPDGSGYCLLEVNETNFADAFDAATATFVDDPLSANGSGGRYIVNYFTDPRWEGVEITDVDIDGGAGFVTYDALGGTVEGGLIPGTGGTVEVSFDGSVYELNIAAFTGKLTVLKVS